MQTKEKTQTHRGEADMKMKAEIGMTMSTLIVVLRNTKECQMSPRS